MALATEQRAGGLQRSVGFWGLLFVSLGSIIGSGWLLGALNVAKTAGPAGVISWVIGAIMLSTLALIYAELGAAYPVAGGTARFAYFSHGPIAGFVSGWASWLQAVFLAPVEIEAMLSYLSSVHWFKQHLNFINNQDLLNGTGLITATILMVVFTALNLAGAKLLAESNTGIVIWKTAVPVLTLIVIGILSFHGGNFTTSSNHHSSGGGFAPFGLHGIFAALPVGVVFALQGFEQAAQLAGEAKNPKKHLSRAILGAMAIGASIYLLLELVFVAALDPKNLANGWGNPLGGSGGSFGAWYDLAIGLGAGWLGYILIVDSVISPGGTGLVYLGTTARISYALGEEPELPSALCKTSRRGVPWVSILLAAVVGELAFGPFKGWSQLVSVITDTTAIMYAFAPVALGALQKKDLERERPYRMPMPQILLPAGFAFAGLLIYWSGWDTVWKMDLLVLIGLIIFCVGAAVQKTDAFTKVKHAYWVLPWLVGLTLLSSMGRYGSWGPTDSKADGYFIKYHSWLTRYHDFLPSSWDLLIVIAFSMIIYFWAANSMMSQEDIDAAIEHDAHQINFLAE